MTTNLNTGFLTPETAAVLRTGLEDFVGEVFSDGHEMASYMAMDPQERTAEDDHNLKRQHQLQCAIERVIALGEERGYFLPGPSPF